MRSGEPRYDSPDAPLYTARSIPLLLLEPSPLPSFPFPALRAAFIPTRRTIARPAIKMSYLK